MVYTSLKQVEGAFDVRFNDTHIKHKYNETIVLAIFNGAYIPLDMITHNIYGLYHKFITKDLDKMFKHFKISAQMGNMDAMKNISDNHIKYSEFESNEYIVDEIIFYYTWALNSGHIYVLYNLAKFYYSIQRYDDFYYYIKICISNICKTSDINDSYLKGMLLLGNYYKTVVYNYDKMKYAYKETIVRGGSKTAIIEMSEYYDTIEINDSHDLKRDYLFECIDGITSYDAINTVLCCIM